MTKKDANRIIAILQANYPDTTKDMTDEAYLVKVNLWAEEFKDEPFEIVAAAVKAYMANSTARFAPNVGQIKEQIRLLLHPNELTEGEAWAMVQAAMRNSVYGAAEEFAKFPPMVQKVVGSPANLREWGMTEGDAAVSVIASNFQRSYRAIQAREAALEKTPAPIREMFAALTAPMQPAIEEKTGKPALAPADEIVITEDARRAAIEKLRSSVLKREGL